MQGLVNRAVERFVRDSHGDEAWRGIMARLDLGYGEFEAMLNYDPEITARLLEEVAAALDRPEAEVLEDIGTYLVTHPNTAAVRRLLRFGGDTFEEFLHSLEDLPGRARLALPDLALPPLDLTQHRGDQYTLSVGGARDMAGGFGHVILGLLRALADDYGALAVLEHKGGGGSERIGITLAALDHSQGRDFSLGAAP